MAIYLESLYGIVNFFQPRERDLELANNCAKRQSKLDAYFFYSEIYGYTQFKMRGALVCKFFFTLKLWPDKVFNSHFPAINYPVEAKSYK